jgi:aminoglycoside phosphotransferase (APT) family kinase protein
MGRPVPDLSRALLDPEETFGEICSIARDVLGARVAVGDVTVERLERRVLRYNIDLGSDSPPWIVIGKVYDRAIEGQHGFDVMRRLWESGFSRQPPTSVHMPRAYRYLPDQRLLLMEHAPGGALKKLVKEKIAGSEQMRLFGSALIKLHRSPLVLGDPFGVEQHLSIRCAGLHPALAEAVPGLGSRVKWIVERARELETSGSPTLTLAHGDFHLGQVHVSDREVWILDLDPLHLGDPAYDVAMLFVMLKHLEQRTHDGAYVRSLRDGFLAAYFGDTDCRLAGRVPLHMALIHLKRACKRFRWQDEPGWRETIQHQINEGVECMEAMHPMPVPQCVSEVAAIYERCPATV